MKTEVKCSQCDKTLFTTSIPSDSRGRIAAEVRRRKFIAKLYFLYGHNRFEFFCDKKCCKKWFEENITEEAREKGNEAFAQLSEKLRSEEFVDGLQKGLSRIQRIFKKRRLL